MNNQISQFIRQNKSICNILQDIAIIKLPVNVLFGRTVSSVNLPSKSEANKTYMNAKTTVSGYGRTSDAASQVSHVLNYVDMRVIQTKECASIFGTKIVTRNVICAKGWANKQDNACLGGEWTTNLSCMRLVVKLIKFCTIINQILAVR